MREMDSPYLEVKETFYSPVWLRIVNRTGKYFMFADSLVEEINSCGRLAKKEFYQCLKENNLSIRESGNNYIISKF